MVRPLKENKMKISMPDKSFKVEDQVLPTLDLPNPCPIRIEIRDDCIFLYVGVRDWQWDFDDEQWVGSGTRLSPE